MAKDLSAFFYPKSIAVIGASRSPEKVGSVILKNIIVSGFKGQIFPINPQAESINNLKCYPDMASLPQIPDLVVITIPSLKVIEILTQVGERGTKNVVIISAGFKEAGAEGQNLEKQLITIAQKYQLNILGPNCLGFINNLVPLNATFGEIVSNTGNLRFISQSGAIATSLFDYCKSTGLGFNEFVTLGNKATLNESDFLEYFQTTPRVAPQDGLSNVQPIGLYLESISDGAKFLQLTSQITNTDPIFVLKPGKTSAAAAAMQSHTGAIAGEDAVLDAVLSQAGIIRCQTLEDFFDFSRAFAWENVPLGPKVAVISNAGGPAVISADAITLEGLQLAEFDDQIKQKLMEILPRSASVHNPIDVLGDALADRFGSAIEIALQTDQVDSLIVILTPQVMTQIGQTAQIIGTMSKKYKKPILCSFIGGKLVSEGEQKLNDYKIPSFRFPERAIAALGAMWKFKNRPLRNRSVNGSPTQTPDVPEKVLQIIQNAVGKNQKTLDNLQANEVISSVSIATPPGCIASDLKSAQDFTKNYGWPVVLKLSSPGLLHKKDVGGVICDIRNLNQLENAWDKLQRKITEMPSDIQNQVKIQVQKEVAEGIEVIIGVKHDPTFGPVLLFGAGGSFAELIQDRNLHLLPIDNFQIQKLVEGSKVYSLLKKKDGEISYSLDKLYQTITSLSNLARRVPQFSDIEINPAIVTINDVLAVDTKIILKNKEDRFVPSPQFKTATTIKHIVLASTFHYFTFQTEEPLVFRPGQYISIKVSYNKVNCYSLAGVENPNIIHLLINTAPGGPGSKFFESLKAGDKITFLGPFGTFKLREDNIRHLLFLATGSGLAPLIYMIEYLLKFKNSSTLMTLYLGLTAIEDVFWQDRFKAIKQEYPNFNYKIVVWKPNASWQGDKGFITEHLKNDFPQAQDCSAYLCGNKNMIEDASQILIERGCPSERIYTEKF